MKRNILESKLDDFFTDLEDKFIEFYNGPFDDFSFSVSQKIMKLMDTVSQYRLRHNLKNLNDRKKRNL